MTEKEIMNERERDIEWERKRWRMNDGERDNELMRAKEIMNESEWENEWGSKI